VDADAPAHTVPQPFAAMAATFHESFAASYVHCDGRRNAPTRTSRESVMRNAPGNAPTLVVWIISLVLFIVAVAAQFGVIRIGQPIMPWLWIIGYALLLIACRVRGM
jgi:hypothetical protein